MNPSASVKKDRVTTGFLFNSRRFIRQVLLAAMALPMLAIAQSAYPTKPIKIVVPFGAGSGPDITARLWAERLARSYGQPVVIDNKPGASTIIGAQAVATAPADGYTLLYTVNNTTSINPSLYKTLPYKVEDFVAVSQIVSVPYVLIVPADSPFRTLQDLVNTAKSRPNQLNYASYGIGQGTHVAMAWFLNATGATMTHVPYRDGGAADVMAGRITASFDSAATAIPLIQSGKLRALAVSGTRRVQALSSVPTVAETVPGFVGDSWHGLLAPKGTPQAVIDKLSASLREVVATEEFRRRVTDVGLVPVGSTPAEFAKFLVDDAQAWGKVVTVNNIRAE